LLRRKAYRVGIAVSSFLSRLFWILNSLISKGEEKKREGSKGGNKNQRMLLKIA
jgi:hypothetical protein